MHVITHKTNIGVCMFIRMVTTSKSVSKTAIEARFEMSELSQFIDVSC